MSKILYWMSIERENILQTLYYIRTTENEDVLTIAHFLVIQLFWHHADI